MKIQCRSLYLRAFRTAAILVGMMATSALHAATTIMPLGDSITAGFTVTDSYRREVYTDLTAAGMPIQFVGVSSDFSSSYLTGLGEQYHNGYSNYRMDQIFSNLSGSLQPSSAANNLGGYWLTGGGGTGRSAVFPDYVLLLAGTNDIAQGASASLVESRMTSLATWFELNRPATKVILGTVIPFGPTAANFASLNQTVVTYNSWLVSNASSFGSNFSTVDLYNIFTTSPNSTTAIKDSTSPDGIYLPDGVHPSANAYVAMGKAWSAQVETVAAPEPCSAALLGLGGVSLLFLRRRSVSR